MRLYVSQPKEKWISTTKGELSVHNGEAMFFDGERLVASLERTQMMRFGCGIVALSGFEECGFEKNGKKKFRYQEWFVHLDMNKGADGKQQ